MVILTQQRNIARTSRLLMSTLLCLFIVVSSLASAREISITNERLEVSLAIPEGLLTVRDRESDVRWRQFLPTKHVLRGRSWDIVRVTPVAPDRLIRIDQAEANGNVIHAKATWRGEPFTIRYALLENQNRLRVTVDTPKRAQPLPWKPDWMGGKLMTKDKPGFEELFLGVEFNPARRIPLFQLVYHDSVYCTRRWNQDPIRAPELWTRHDLMNIINGTSSLWMMRDGAKNMIGTADWETVKDRYLQTYRDVCGWHEKIGFDEMLDHQFLSDDRLVQQSCFSSGWTVVVNFSDDAWKDTRGFLVKAHSHYTFQE